MVLSLGGIVILVHGWKYLKANSESFNYNLDKIKLKTYLIKDIECYSTLSRFTLILKGLICAGIPAAKALATANGMIDNRIIKEKLCRQMSFFI